MKKSTYSVAKLKAHVSAALSKVAEGEEVYITDHNRVVARIVSASPIPPLPRCSLKKFLKFKPIKLAKGAVDSATLIRQIRDEEIH